MKPNAFNPWVKHYSLGPVKLSQTMHPYPKVPVFHFLDEVAAHHPSKSACFYMGRKITFKQLKRYVDKLANALVDLGIKKGHKVVTCLPTSPQFVIADHAIQKSGAVHVPCSLWNKSHEFIDEIDEIGAEIIFCLDTHAEFIKSIIGQTKLNTVIVTALNDFSAYEPEMIEISGALQLRDIISLAGSDPPSVGVDPLEDPALIVFTRRGFGKSRGAMLTHYNLTSNTLQSLPWILDSMGKGMKQKSSMLIATPVYHLHGHWAIRTALFWGLKMLLVSDPNDTNTILKMLKEHRPVMAHLDITQYLQLVKQKIGRMNTIFTCGGSLIPTEVSMKFEKLTGMPITQIYGYDVAAPITHVNFSGLSKIKGGPAFEKSGSIGVPVVDTEAKLVDSSSGGEVEHGGVGELYIRGPQVMKGYWPTSGDGLVDDWLPTGDLCRMDDDGCFFLSDQNNEKRVCHCGRGH